MYSKIQQEKKQGFTRDAVARHLRLSWRTVDRYWLMTPKEYEELSRQQYRSILDKRGPVIKEWLERFPDLSAAQVQDWLQEHYEELYNERTVRQYVSTLRKKYGIQKPKKEREYFCTEELPPGRQLQADFGQYWAIRQGKNRIKLYLAAFILAHSRYKYVYWQTRPFNAVDFIRALESCFEEFGGIMQELVIDQDTLMTVSENNGDIIHALEFEHCKNRHRFSVWLCRTSDPETKGMVESCVKFIKYNFARNRYFYDIAGWTEDCRLWLMRTGNGKVHAETKKIPAKVFAIEQKHLKPVQSLLNHHNINTDAITTPVRKNNTVRYKSVRYSVPLGTYTACKTAILWEVDEHLEIYDEEGKLLAKHVLAERPGALVINNNHARNTSERINQLTDDAKKALGNTPLAEEFLAVIRKKKGRYIRDQLRVVMKVAGSYDAEVIRLALMACQESNLDSANDLRDFAEHIFRQTTVDEVFNILPVRPITGIPDRNIKVMQHQPGSYMKLVPKGGN